MLNQENINQLKILRKFLTEQISDIFLLKWLLFIFNTLRFSSTQKTYCFEVSRSRLYEDKKEYFESALSEYLEKYGLSTTNKSLSTLISLLKEIN